MAKELVLDIERYLEHQVWVSFRKLGWKVPFLSDSISPFVDPSTNDIFKARSYFMLDFNDFLDYATSNLPEQFKISNLPEGHPYFYDAFPGTFEEGMFEEAYGKFSVVGVALSRYKEKMGIFMQFRINEDWPPIYKEVIESDYARGLFSKNHLFPYEFIHLTLWHSQRNNEIFEANRCLLVPPIIVGEDNYGNAYQGQITEAIKKFYAELMDKDPKKINGPTSLMISPAMQEVFDKQFNNYKTHFEIARLMLHLPSYFNFMYDVVISEKRKIGTKTIKLSKIKKNKIKTGKPIYRIVKSIRLNYQAEEETRRKLNTPRRSWKAPSYSFAVSGHWRKLTHPWWKGHDPDGKEVIGKTWVTEHTKGKNNSNLENYETVNKDPNVVIKLKQKLSYARDVIKAQENKKSFDEKLSKIVPAPLEEKPSELWMYEERRKLTAGLRFIIFQRDKFKCQLCGASGVESKVRLEVDHIIPISKWGRTEETNLQTICRECNIGKRDQIISF